MKTEPSHFDINAFNAIIQEIKHGNRSERELQIKRLYKLPGLICHHFNKVTKRTVWASYDRFEFPHEFHTSIKLTTVNYDVMLVPKGYFKREEKKFDVFLSSQHIFIEADLKCITTNNVDTIGKRIKEGSRQANRIVLDITSVIKKYDLIDGLRLGCQRNNDLKEIMLFYNSRFYRLFTTQILAKGIYKIIE